MEVERKWLVREPPAGVLAYAAEPIDQGYLAICDDGTEVRVRRRGERCSLTVKSGRGLERNEFETPLSGDQFEALWPATAGRRVQKTRRALPGPNGLTIELDLFAGALAGLVVAEVEFADVAAAQQFDAPAWFGREVTGEAVYSNQRLAVQGKPG